MDILFVSSIEMESTNSAPQLGQFSLWNILKNNYQCKVINFDYLNLIGDFEYSYNDTENNIVLMANEILRYGSRIIGFYTISSTYHIALDIADRIKKLKPEVKILLGGPLATLTAYESLSSYSYIDCIALGESELYIEELIRRLLLNISLDDLDGVAYRDNNNNKIVVHYNNNMISREQLSQYTVYDYGDVDIAKLGAVAIDAGRGCPYNCTFCSTNSFWGRKFRIKSPEQLLAEVNHYYNKYGISFFSFNHDMFTSNREVVVKFCNLMLNNEKSISWGCSSRIDALDKATLDIMAKANCKTIYIGIETGSQTMQNKICKNLNLIKTKEMLEYAFSLGIKLTISFIYGLPDEKIEYFYETIQFIEWLLLKGIGQIQLHLFMPLPKTAATGLVYEDLYIDYNSVDVSILNPKNLTPRMKQNIEIHKNIFSAFYTFDTEVRLRFNKIDVLVIGIVSLFSSYKFIIKSILKKHGIIYLYTKYKNEVLYCAENLHSDCSTTSNVSNKYLSARELAKHIILDLGYDKIYPEMFEFETELFEVQNTDEKISYIKLYQKDVITLRENNKVINEPIMVRFYRNDKKIGFSKLNVKL